MSKQTSTAAILAYAAVSLFGISAVTAQTAEEPHSIHRGDEVDPTPTTQDAGTNAFTLKEPVAAETQSPPGIIGKDWPQPIEDNRPFGFLLFDQLEYRAKSDSDDTVRWDVQAWYGTDYNRIWVKTEGEWRTEGERGGEAEVQALYSRLISPFWDFQIGLRYDQLSGANFDRGRGFAVIGFQALIPYRFDIEPALFISDDGDVSARFTTTYELLLTQRLILQPRLDIDAALQSAEDFGVGEGLNSIGLGLRLRYEITREFAPYIGVHWLHRFGETADLSRRDGGDVEDLAFVVGVRLYF